MFKMDILYRFFHKYPVYSVTSKSVPFRRLDSPEERRGRGLTATSQRKPLNPAPSSSNLRIRRMMDIRFLQPRRKPRRQKQHNKTRTPNSRLNPNTSLPLTTASQSSRFSLVRGLDRLTESTKLPLLFIMNAEHKSYVSTYPFLQQEAKPTIQDSLTPIETIMILKERYYGYMYYSHLCKVCRLYQGLSVPSKVQENPLCP